MTQEAIKAQCATACLAMFCSLKPIQVSLIIYHYIHLISQSSVFVTFTSGRQKIIEQKIGI